MKALGCGLVGLVLAVCVAGPAGAQEHGTIAGVVRDEAGRPVAAATVRVLGAAPTATTGASGRFVLARIAAGRHVVEATALGYGARRDTVRVAGGDTVWLRLTLGRTPLLMAPVVVTASKRATPLQDVPVSVAVVGERELERRPDTDLARAIARVPGVQFLGGQVNIRGATGYARGAGGRVLLLVDGVPWNTGDTGGINWDALPVTEVERVEVLKGAGSALYGSGALGGVVHVMLREPEDRPATRLRALGGGYFSPLYSWGDWSDWPRPFGAVDGAHSRRVGDTGVLAAAGWRHSDGYRENGTSTRLHGLGKLTHPLPGDGRLSALVTWAREDYGFLGEWAGRDDPYRVPEATRGDHVVSDKLGAYLTARAGIGAAWSYTARASLYRTDWRQVFGTGTDFSTTNRWGVEARLRWQGGEGHVVTGGVEASHTGVRSGIFGTPALGDVAVYLQDEIRVGPATATLGARLDGRRTAGEGSARWAGELSPRAGIVVGRGASRIRTSLGRGYRSPAPAELFVRTTVQGVQVRPNPELQPERAWTGEVGVNHRVGHWIMADGAVFWNRYDGLVQAVYDTAGASVRFDNVTAARIRGTELTVQAVDPGGRADVRVGYTYLDAEDLDTGEALPYRSAHQLTATANVRHGPFALGADYRMRSAPERVLSVPGLDESRVPIHVLDLHASAVWRGWGVRVGLNNALQYHYVTVQETPGPLRHVSIAIQTEF